MIRLILLLILAYIVYKTIVNVLGYFRMKKNTSEESYYIDEDGQLRKIKDITKEAKIYKE